MIEANYLRNALCSVFCESISVNVVPCGFAVSAVYEDGSGDKIGFYIVPEDGKYALEDDGNYLSHMVASGIDIEKGGREQLLRAILESGEAYWDTESYEIKSARLLTDEEVAEEAIRFLSILIRVRDLELITREFVRSTFRDDAKAAIVARFSSFATISERTAVSRQLADFPADILIRPKDDGRSAAVFLANNTVTFQEAELLRAEIAKEQRASQISVIALIEETQKINVIGPRRFQRAQNRGLVMPIFRGDEEAALDKIEEQIRPAKADYTELTRRPF